MRESAFQQGVGAELNSAQESFCNVQKMPAQMLAWALAPLAATEPRQEADSLTAQRRRKRRKRRRRRCGKGLGSETQDSPGSGSLDLSGLWREVGSVHCPLETMCWSLLGTYPEILLTHHPQMWGSSLPKQKLLPELPPQLDTCP